jgi:hypothetical protein
VLPCFETELQSKDAASSGRFAMSKKDMSRDLRHAFAEEFLYKNYGIKPKQQSSVIYKLRDGKKCLILVGKTNSAFQAIRSANFDMLRANDTIVFYNATTGVMVSFYKQELLELLECGYINWHSAISGPEGFTTTRILLQLRERSGKPYLYFSSLGSTPLLIAIKDIQKRAAKSGDPIGDKNLLVGGMTYYREAA